MDTANANDGTLPAEQPQLTGQEKFRRGGFKPAAEVIAEVEAAPAAAAESADPVMAAAIAADTAAYQMDPEVPVEGLSVTNQPEAAATEETPAQAEKIKLGGREFSTQEEAWAYAEQLQAEKDTADAFRQGVELASQATKGNPPPPQTAPELPREIDPEYYTNPQAYFAKREQEIIQRAEQVITQKQQAQASERALWDGFYKDYPDLSHLPDLVQLTMQQNWQTLQHIETKAALKQLADKTRAKLQPYKEANTPKVQLPKAPTAVSAGGAPGVTTKAAPKPALNFTQQLKQNKKGRAQLR